MDQSATWHQTMVSQRNKPLWHQFCGLSIWPKLWSRSFVKLSPGCTQMWCWLDGSRRDRLVIVPVFCQTSFKQGFNQYTAIAMIEPVNCFFQHLKSGKWSLRSLKSCQLSVHVERSCLIPDLQKPISNALFKLCCITNYWLCTHVIIRFLWFGFLITVCFAHAHLQLEWRSKWEKHGKTVHGKTESLIPVINEDDVEILSLLFSITGNKIKKLNIQELQCIAVSQWYNASVHAGIKQIVFFKIIWRI